MVQKSPTLSFYLNTLEDYLRPGVSLLWSQYFEKPFKNRGAKFMISILLKPIFMIRGAKIMILFKNKGSAFAFHWESYSEWHTELIINMKIVCKIHDMSMKKGSYSECDVWCNALSPVSFNFFSGISEFVSEEIDIKDEPLCLPPEIEEVGCILYVVYFLQFIALF